MEEEIRIIEENSQDFNNLGNKSENSEESDNNHHNNHIFIENELEISREESNNNNPFDNNNSNEIHCNLSENQLNMNVIREETNERTIEELAQISAGYADNLSHDSGLKKAFGTLELPQDILSIMEKKVFPFNSSFDEFENCSIPPNSEFYNYLQNGKIPKFRNANLSNIFRNKPRSFNLKQMNIGNYLNAIVSISDLDLGTEAKQKNWFKSKSRNNKLNAVDQDYSYKHYQEDLIKLKPREYKMYFCPCNNKMELMNKDIQTCPLCKDKIKEINCVCMFDINERLQTIFSNRKLYDMVLLKCNSNRNAPQTPSEKTKIGDISTGFFYIQLMKTNFPNLASLPFTLTMFIDKTNMHNNSKNNNACYVKAVINEIDGEERFKYENMITLCAYQDRTDEENHIVFEPLIAYLQLIFYERQTLHFYHYIKQSDNTFKTIVNSCCITNLYYY